MKHLTKVQTGKQKKPHLILLYGPDGVGKSTFAAAAPSPIFIGTEAGTGFIDVSRMTSPVNWLEFTEQVKELMHEKHEYKTLVIDSLDWLEILLHKKICDEYKVKSIELAAGGYGKGYVEAFNTWCIMRDVFNYLREKRNMNIILLAHSESVPFNDPATQATYDRYQIKLHKKSAAMFREYVDFLLFANFEVIAKEEKGKIRAFGDGMRLLFTERRPGWDAKSRQKLPFYLPLSYHEFENALSPRDVGEIKKEIDEILLTFIDESFKKVVMDTIQKAGSNIITLEEILNRLKVKQNETQ